MTSNDLVLAKSASLRALLNGHFFAEVFAGIAALVFLACVGLLSVWSLSPPEIVNNVAPTGFSAARARDYLKAIAAKPHPIGSPTHAEVRDYVVSELVKIGLHPQVQKTTAVNTLWGRPYRAATVENIVAKLDGTQSTRAVLLVAHYDAAPTSLGASDDGAAVATLLETMRALKANAPLKNDVIFLATDGEEAGLLGAIAFSQQHPWTKDVGVVLNFEARGDHGPSIMFQTSNENGWLIDEFAQTANRPVANSLAADIYRLLPNDTDFTVFNRAGMSGLNFAYIEGSTAYHSTLDNMSNLDERSLQHHGLYALALARRLGNANLSQPPKKSDAVYFDLFGRTLIHYSRATAIALAIVTVLLAVGVVVFGVRRRLLTLPGLAWGALALLLSVIGAALVAMLTSRVLAIVPGSGASFMQQDTWTNHLYLSGFVLLAVAATAFVYGVFSRRVSASNLAVGALLWFVLLLIISVIYLPGGSYLLLWPLLAALVAWILKLMLPPRSLSPGRFNLIATLCAVPGVILLAPIIYQVFVAFGVSQTLIVVIPVTLLLGLFVINFDLIASATRWLLPAVCAVIAVGLLIAAIAQPDFNQQQPRSDQIFYALNADTGKAVWASADAQPDQWTSQFLAPDARAAAIKDDLPWLGDRRFLQQQTSTASLPAPDVTVLADDYQDQTRSVHLQVSSPREAAQLFVYVDGDVSEGFLNGQQLNGPGSTPVKDWMLIYSAPPREGIDLLLITKSAAELKLKVVDRSFQLPELKDFTITPRPDDIIPAPFTYTDSTFVSKSFSFPPGAHAATAGLPTTQRQ